ncbi:UPF0149 family protein [Sphingomonas sp. H39-1-10]|uniref:UPF0149 family protein n=1 Tax=Sphingomonas pollutisoli TaxID=3030829 RepID=UPI0023B94274|nr:UPF0149 family protein [Sphingomonas pollutisoli]MDF0489771.1 UPF0149 family protein [Sphingomonas pollutisoli]
MAKLPSRLRRLDDILYDLPDDAMLLSELDGYLAGIATAPEPIAPAEWLPPIWGGLYGEAAPFDDPLDADLFADMVVARHGEILRDLGRGKLQPIFDVDDRNGEVLWEIWIAGFAEAMALRDGAWRAASGDDAAALSYLRTLADIADNTTALTSIEVNAISDAAPGKIAGQVLRLYAARRGAGGALPETGARAAKVGRNDPCPCGSGKKFKKCCAA